MIFASRSNIIRQQGVGEDSSWLRICNVITSLKEKLFSTYELKSCITSLENYPKFSAIYGRSHFSSSYDFRRLSNTTCCSTQIFKIIAILLELEPVGVLR